MIESIFYILNSKTMIIYNRLIRDGVLKKIEDTWDTATYHTVSDEEFGIKIKEKLIEEATEVHQATTREEIKNELSDVFKIGKEIMKLYAITEEELAEVMRKKDEKVGGFDQRIILEEASEF